MAGGRGSRLEVLTKDRSKSAVSVLGHYRIFDFVATNIENSGIPVMLVATQFEPGTLSMHIGDGETWGFNGINKVMEINYPHEEGRQFITFKGTADSVRKSIDRIDRYRPDIVLVLAADHVYIMDYTDALKWHELNNADITIMANVVSESKVRNFGAIKIDESCRIIDFVEKPKDQDTIDNFRLTPKIKSLLGITDPNLNFLVSMGNYIFYWDRLKHFLNDYAEGMDFGLNIIPAIRQNSKSVYAYVFDDYWRDVGIIKDYFDCNMEFASDNPPIDLSKNQIRTYERHLPGAKISCNTDLNNVIVSGGDIIGRNCEISNCVFGYQVIVQDECKLDHCVFLGASRNEYHNNKIRLKYTTNVGKGASLSYVILDKNVWIGEGVNINPNNGTIEERVKSLLKLGLKPYRELEDDTVEGDFSIEPSTGILVIGKQREADPKHPIIPNGYRI
ncbi:MAG: glucose-1-phosphate adenylyltransferase family protein [Candidatus Poribacteria bacterium]